MKKILALVLTMIMVLSLVACAAPAAEAPAAVPEAPAAEAPKAEAAPVEELEPMNFIVASSASSSLATYAMQEKCAAAVTEKTGGKLTFDLNWDGILGNDAALVENCIAGSIPMVSLMSSALVNYVPEVGVFDCPAVFGSEAEAYEGVKAMIETLNPYFEAKGLKILSMGFQTFRALSTNRNLAAPADFEGMRIRTLENKFHMGFWNNLGSIATPLAFSDLYLSLQQGMVDAQDNAAPAVYANKFFEVQDYYMATPVFMNVAMIICNKDLYDSMDASYQEAVVEFASNYTQGAYEFGAQDIEDALAKMPDLEVIPVTDEILTAMQAAGKPIWDDIADALGADLVDSYLAIAGLSR